MITRSRVALVLLLALAANLALVGAARPQDSVQEAEPGALETYFPGVKSLMDFLRSTGDTLDRLKRILDNALTRTNPNGQPALAEDAPEPPPDAQAERRLRDEYVDALTNAMRRQNSLVDTVRTQFRSHVSTSLDKCRQSVAARDEAGARASCGTAEKVIDGCTRHAREINELADRLTALYRLDRDRDNTFSTLHCPFVFAGLDDPRAILSRAEFGLPDEACYQHAAIVERFAKGTPPVSFRLKDYESVPAYLAYIRRNCSEKIANQAQLDVDAALKAKAEADRLAEEKAEAERRQAERRLAEEEAEAERRAAERRLAEERAEEQRREAERRLAEEENRPPGETGVLRRSDSSGAFENAINQAEIERQDNADRERRRREQPPVVADRSRGSDGGFGSSPPAPAHTATPRASVGGKSCREILQSLAGPVNEGNPMSAAGSNLRYPLGQIYSDQVWAAQTYVRVANTHPACANDPSSREAVMATLRSTQGYCRQVESMRTGGPFNCNSGQSFGGTAARTEAAIRQVFQERSSTEGGSTSNVRPASGECSAAHAQQEAAFGPLSQRIANTQSAVTQLQLLMGMLSKRMALLDKLCRGQSQYAEYAGTRQQFDSAMRNCRGLASNPADCGPR